MRASILQPLLALIQSRYWLVMSPPFDDIDVASDPPPKCAEGGSGAPHLGQLLLSCLQGETAWFQPACNYPCCSSTNLNQHCFMGSAMLSPHAPCLPAAGLMSTVQIQNHDCLRALAHPATAYADLDIVFPDTGSSRQPSCHRCLRSFSPSALCTQLAVTALAAQCSPCTRRLLL